MFLTRVCRLYNYNLIFFSFCRVQLVVGKEYVWFRPDMTLRGWVGCETSSVFLPICLSVCSCASPWEKDSGCLFQCFCCSNFCLEDPWLSWLLLSLHFRWKAAWYRQTSFLNSTKRDLWDSDVEESFVYFGSWKWVCPPEDYSHIREVDRIGCDFVTIRSRRYYIEWSQQHRALCKIRIKLFMTKINFSMIASPQKFVCFLNKIKKQTKQKLNPKNKMNQWKFILIILLRFWGLVWAT